MGSLGESVTRIGEKMEKIDITLIVSSDEDIRSRFANLLNQAGAAYVFESKQAVALLRILEIDFRLTIVDLDSIEDHNIDFIKVVRILRPRLPVIVIVDDSFKHAYDEYLEAGASYCLVKSDDKEQIEVLKKEAILGEGYSE